MRLRTNSDLHGISEVHVVEYDGLRRVATADGTFTVRRLPTANYVAAGVDRIEGSETSGEWEDPAVPESLLPYARRVALSEGQTTSASLRLTVR